MMYSNTSTTKVQIKYNSDMLHDITSNEALPPDKATDNLHVYYCCCCQTNADVSDYF